MKIKFNYLAMGNLHKPEIPKTGKMRCICQPEPEMGLGIWGFKRKEGNAQEEWKEEMLSKQMFARPSGKQRNLGISSNRTC